MLSNRKLEFRAVQGWFADCWGRLSVRERWIVGSGSVVLVLALLVFGFIDVLWERVERLERQVSRTAHTLAELRTLEAEYRDLQGRLEVIDGRLRSTRPRAPLLTWAEEAAARCGVRDRIDAMHPQAAVSVSGFNSSSVEIRFDRIDLPHLLTFLMEVDRSLSIVQVKRLQLKPRFEAPQFLDATILLATYERV